jgi:RHS repeat-associated protein
MQAATRQSCNYDFGGGLGYWHEDGVDLYYARDRWYQSENGLWLSRDSIVGEPPYSYVGQQPTNRTDPSGMRPILPPIFTHEGMSSGSGCGEPFDAVKQIKHRLTPCQTKTRSELRKWVDEVK